ncbi:MAG: FAD-dependent oxidoreductase, partial [Bacteroidetes bacterium]|nr:FAD-dependent oxidoreductase [Bacteroidota bacterium]
MKFFHILIFAVLGAIIFSCEEEGPKPNKVDICVYGGTSAGVMAAYSAAKMGKSVMLIEPGKHLGGLTSGGLGATDIGNKYAITGLARDFYRKIGQHYGEFEQWTFEPKVAEEIFNDLITRAGVQVKYQHQVICVEKLGTEIRSITLESSDTLNLGAPVTVRASMYIDCSYEGDLMARAGVSYSVGREPNSKYNETYNGVQMLDGHQFPDGVDPYKIKGDKTSGYLWGISGDSLAAKGTGDSMVQAYNFRVTLTNDPLNMLPIYEPEGFDPDRYELLIRTMEVKPWQSIHDGFIWSLMPNGKTDINNRGPFSTDMIGMNHDYPEADYKE